MRKGIVLIAGLLAMMSGASSEVWEGPCRIEMRSMGLNDVVAEAVKTSYIKVNGVTHFNAPYARYVENRGFNLLTLDPATCEVTNPTTFDTYGDAARNAALKTYIDNVPNGKVILGVTSDSADQFLNDVGKGALSSIGVDVTGISYRSKVLFSTLKGSTKTFVDRRAAGGESLLYLYDPCRIEMRSMGLVDDVAEAVKTSYIKVNEVTHFNVPYARYVENRGFNLLTLDPATCEVTNPTTFDTYGDAARNAALKTYIDNVPNGKVILGVTSDSADQFLNDVGKGALSSIGVDVTGISLRSKVLFSAVKGSTNAFVRARASGGESLLHSYAFGKHSAS